MLIYAHRGASVVEPENTLRAFQRALELGVDGIELDVRFTADGVPVVIHDRSLERTTSGFCRDNVDELTLEEVRQWDVGKGERVPTLEEVLRLIGDRAVVDIELKQPGSERAVLDVLRRHPETRWAVSAFDWAVLRAVRDLAPDAPLLPLSVLVTDALFAVAAELRAAAVALSSPAYTAATAPRFAEAGLPVVVWTVNDVESAKRARDLGAFGLCTDVPDEIMRGLDHRP